ncbi:hypothetical protein ACFO4O_17005 [Glaciecola siphonariae]|uniref:Uncharacterized protein n=1 Tax=Glaciecola siphonariae TaxID=521012 RepID=A0ABV9M142_9ALTE
MDILVKQTPINAQLIVNVLVVFLLFLVSLVRILSADMPLMLTAILSLMWAAILAYVGSIMARSWRRWQKQQQGQACLKAQHFLLDHDSNTLSEIYCGEQDLSYSIDARSKANSYCLWLYLKRAGEGDKASFKRMFLHRWQLDTRSFCALHRHINWFITERGA